MLNITSLQQYCRELRQLKTIKIKNELNNIDLNAAVIHWDGKLLPSLTERKTVDKLLITITNNDIEQIFHIPSLENGTEKMQTRAIFHILCD